MPDFVRHHWPILLSITLLIFLVAGLLIASTSRTQGHFVYVLDDPYIHMAMAKNFSEFGVWGVTRYEFTSATSSILWTFLLSATYFLFGNSETAPLVLNVIFGILILFSIYVLLNQSGLSKTSLFLILLGTAFSIPLPALIFGGMEHGLQSLMTILFLFASARELASELNRTMLLGLLASLTTLVRFEGFFLVGLVILLLLLRRRFSAAITILIWTILPYVAYQLTAVHYGWFWLPNSILVRANIIQGIMSTSGDPLWLRLVHKVFGILREGYQHSAEAPHLLSITAVVTALFIYRHRKGAPLWDETQIMNLLCGMSTICHPAFAHIGQFYRYEAYLVATGLFVIAYNFKDPQLRQAVSRTFQESAIPKYAMVCLLALPLLWRGAESLNLLPQATKNIYEQQYQMASFIRRFYQEGSIAANDIGAINYYADVHCLDLVGIASSEVARKKSEGTYDQTAIHEIAQSKGVQIAIVYDHWFNRDSTSRLPPQWERIGRWAITNNVVVSGDTVSFYAVNDSERDKLEEHLRTFSDELPTDVIELGQYVLQRTRN